MSRMVKRLLLLLLLMLSSLHANQNVPIATIKLMMQKDPDSLQPNLALMIGTLYKEGDPANGIVKDSIKAKKYLESAARRKNIMAEISLGQMYLIENNATGYDESMRRVVFANDPRFSVSSGFILADFWLKRGNTVKAISSVKLVADICRDPKAELMVGTAMMNGEIAGSEQEASFYIYNACTSSERDDEVAKICADFDLGE